MFSADPELFFNVDGRVTPLRYGVTWPIPKGRNAGAELCVVDPAEVHQAGRAGVVASEISPHSSRRGICTS